VVLLSKLAPRPTSTPLPLSRLRSTTLVSLLSVRPYKFRLSFILISFLSGYTQSLRPGVKASFGLALDTQKLNAVNPTGPAHKASFFSLPYDSHLTDFFLGRRVIHIRLMNWLCLETKSSHEMSTSVSFLHNLSMSYYRYLYYEEHDFFFLELFHCNERCNL